jgi:hypothetical protein
MSVGVQIAQQLDSLTAVVACRHIWPRWRCRAVGVLRHGGGQRLPPAPAKVTRLRLSGDIEDMTQSLTQLPAGQLVVIGSPGAGKSTPDPE